MSWLDLIQNDLTITTGDGKQYIPVWLNATREKEYNISEFEFPNVDGTLVKRGKPLGKKYALELYFQGNDHLDQADAFDFSADDQRPWKISHPFYGNLIVQPVSLFYDNREYNVTKVTGMVIETITETGPVTSVDPVDQIASLFADLNTAFTQQIILPKPTDITTVTYNNKRNFNLTVPIIKLPKEFEQYNQLLNLANAAVNSAIASPSLAVSATIAFITMPAKFTVGLQTRINTLTQQFQNLRQNVSGLTSVSSKQLYQTFAGSVLSAILFGSSLPLQVGEVLTASQVLSIIDSISELYDKYLADLDSIQSPNGGNASYFIPDANSMINLNNMFNASISNLFRIALQSKKERKLIVEQDTNIIVLTHRIYGLDAFDANIEELISENNLGLNGILQIKKNTTILYYI
jgi:hypothetical protein